MNAADKAPKAPKTAKAQPKQQSLKVPNNVRPQKLPLEQFGATKTPQNGPQIQNLKRAYANFGRRAV